MVKKPSTGTFPVSSGNFILLQSNNSTGWVKVRKSAYFVQRIGLQGLDKKICCDLLLLENPLFNMRMSAPPLSSKDFLQIPHNLHSKRPHAALAKTGRIQNRVFLRVLAMWGEKVWFRYLLLYVFSYFSLSESTRALVLFTYLKHLGYCNISTWRAAIRILE